MRRIQLNLTDKKYEEFKSYACRNHSTIEDVLLNFIDLACIDEYHTPPERLFINNDEYWCTMRVGSDYSYVGKGSSEFKFLILSGSDIYVVVGNNVKIIVADYDYKNKIAAYRLKEEREIIKIRR